MLPPATHRHISHTPHACTIVHAHTCILMHGAQHAGVFLHVWAPPSPGHMGARVAGWAGRGLPVHAHLDNGPLLLSWHKAPLTFAWRPQGQGRTCGGGGGGVSVKEQPALELSRSRHDVYSDVCGEEMEEPPEPAHRLLGVRRSWRGRGGSSCPAGPLQSQPQDALSRVPPQQPQMALSPPRRPHRGAPHTLGQVAPVPSPPLRSCAGHPQRGSHLPPTRVNGFLVREMSVIVPKLLDFRARLWSTFLPTLTRCRVSELGRPRPEEGGPRELTEERPQAVSRLSWTPASPASQLVTGHRPQKSSGRSVPACCTGR